MADDRELYVHELLTSGQIKYSYFLLAAAASAIALALKLTENARLDWAQAPLGIAVLCWAASFYCGCRYVEWGHATLAANLTSLLAARGAHPDVPPDPVFRQLAAQGARKAAESNAEHGNRAGKWQFRLLVIGALFFIGWHILGMATRTPAVAANLPTALR